MLKTIIISRRNVDALQRETNKAIESIGKDSIIKVEYRHLLLHESSTCVTGVDPYDMQYSVFILYDLYTNKKEDNIIHTIWETKTE